MQCPKLVIGQDESFKLLLLLVFDPPSRAPYLLISKGGGDYSGIGLLGLIWKVLEQIMVHWLDANELHDCLHGCCANRGTGTKVIEAKLAQQLSYLELKPFFLGVFLDLKNAFDLMEREQCILILEGYWADPRVIQLIRTF
jgi:hypothetical protein